MPHLDPLFEEHDVVACVICQEKDIGIDVEYINLNQPYDDIMPLVFTPDEQSFVHQHPNLEERIKAFF